MVHDPTTVATCKPEARWAISSRRTRSDGTPNRARTAAHASTLARLQIVTCGQALPLGSASGLWLGTVNSPEKQNARRCERRAAERRLARWQAAFALSVLAALCLLLSGCLTAQKALVWSDTVTAWGTKPSASQECKRASLDAAKYLSNANRHIGSAKGLDDLPSRTEAKRLIDEAAKKCDEKH